MKKILILICIFLVLAISLVYASTLTWNSNKSETCWKFTQSTWMMRNAIADTSASIEVWDFRTMTTWYSATKGGYTATDSIPYYIIREVSPNGTTWAKLDSFRVGGGDTLGNFKQWINTTYGFILLNDLRYLRIRTTELIGTNDTCQITLLHFFRK